jgi:PAS domain S-box-containing protein
MEGMADPDRAVAQARPDASELLRAVVFAARKLLTEPDPTRALEEVLGAIGRASGADEVRLAENGGAAGTEDAAAAETRWTSPRPGRAEQSDDVQTASVLVDVNGAPWARLDVHRAGAAWSSAELDAVADAGGLIGAAVARERSDRDVSESRDRYRRLIEQIPAATYVDAEASDGTWPTVYVSPQIEDLFGYSPDEWRANPALWAELVHPDDRQAAFAADTEHYRNGTPLHTEYRMVARDGRVLWVEDIATIATGADGRRYSHGVLSDVSERKERERQLVAAEERFRTLVERTPAITYQEMTGGEYDAAESMVYVSPQIQRILGYPAEDWWTEPGFFTRIMHPDDLQRVLDESNRTTEEAVSYRQEYRMIAKDGQVVWFHDEAVIVPDHSGAGTLWQGVMIDITAQKEAEARLRVAQDRFRALVEHIPAITYTEALDASPENFYISPQVRDILGYDPEEWRWTDNFWIDHVHPDDREWVEAEDRRTNTAQEPCEMEYRIIAKDGRVVWVRDEATLINDQHGIPMFWQGFMLDITDRREALEKLRAAEHRYRSLVENIPAVTYMEATDRSFVDFFISPQLEQVLGWTPEEWASTETFWYDHIHPDDLPAVLEEDRRTDETSDDFDLEFRMRHKDGHWVWIRDSARVVRDDKGRERYWQGFLLDVTERRNAEDSMRAAERRYRSLVENIPAVTYVEGVEQGPDREVFMSPQVESILGYTEREWTREESFWDSRIHPDDFEAVMREDVRTDDNGEPFHVEYRFRHNDGRWIWLRESAVVVKDDDGSARYWQGFMLDITDRKDAERAVEHALTVEREATARLRALDDMKNTFLQAVSHDLRTPLAAILGLAVTLERADLELDVEEGHDLARRIAGNARKLDRLVTDLLDLDRLARGIVEPKLHPSDVSMLVARIVHESEVSSTREVIVEVEPVVVPVDASKLERIVENLLSNAVRHTPADTRVWVRVEAAEDGAVIAVEDEGAGVPPEYRAAVFEPFRQGPDAPTHSPGVGVGLSLVSRFAELHGGRAWVEERKGGGSSFRVFLPAAQADTSRSRAAG